MLCLRCSPSAGARTANTLKEETVAAIVATHVATAEVEAQDPRFCVLFKTNNYLFLNDVHRMAQEDHASQQVEIATVFQAFVNNPASL